MEIKFIRREPGLAKAAAAWFASKWSVPLEAYLESIDRCIAGPGPVPQWYLAMDGGQIVGGCGIIENDFHKRKDLSPNLCALFVEPEHRGRGIARELLSLAREDMGSRGLRRLYLITDHEDLYEKMGWSFLTMVEEEPGPGLTRMYVSDTIKTEPKRG